MTTQNNARPAKTAVPAQTRRQDDAASCLPGTFASRGVRTPFTTKSLRYACVATGQNGRSMISLPGLAGGLGTYELPLNTLRDVFDLSVHDRMLFDSLLSMDKPAPQIVREKAREVAVTGVGGIELARMAARRDKEEKASRELGQLAVLHQALRQLGGAAVQDMERDELMTMEGQIRARKALNRFAHENRVADDTILDSLGEWSTISAPVGLELDGCQGALRVLTHGLGKFASEIAEWASSEQADFRFMAARVENAARATQEHTMRLVRQVDGWHNELGKVLTNWDMAKTDIVDKIGRLWWLLDGWQEFLDLWQKRPLRDRMAQREVVEEIASFVPVLPVEELEPVEYDLWVDIRVNQMMWASELRKLGSGEIDADMVDRLERFRRQSA